MDSEPFRHMEMAKSYLIEARNEVQEAILAMTDTEGVNLVLVKDSKATLSQLLERFDLWQVQPPAPAASTEHRAGPDYVYISLRVTLEEWIEPGKSALVIQLVEYALELGINPDALRQTLATLAQEGRISTRKLDYPSHIPESWEVVFTELQQ